MTDLDLTTLVRPTWPTGEEPTPEAWLEWLDQQTPPNRLVLATRLLESDRRATRCILAMHDAYPHELERTVTRLIDYMTIARRWRALATRRTPRRVLP